MRHLIAAAAFCVLGISLSAQQPATGIPPFSSVQSIGIDSINRQNLNVNFSIPIASTPGRGIDFGFPIANDSLLWMKNGTLWSPVVDGVGNPTWGWKDTLPVGSINYIKV